MTSEAKKMAKHTPVRIKKPQILEQIAHDNHAIIEASAGTGKTYTIEHLVVDLLVNNPDLRIHQILVVTYTERATFELSARIRSLLQSIVDADPALIEDDPNKPAWEIGDAERKRLHRALTAFDLAPIHTIHGFCHRVLVENAFQNHRPFEQEHASFELIFDAVFTDALRREFAYHDAHLPYLAAWLAQKTGGIQELKSFLARCVRHRGKIGPDFDPNRLNQTIAALLTHDPKAFGEAFRAELKEEKVHSRTANLLRDRALELLEKLDAWQENSSDPINPLDIIHAVSTEKNLLYIGAKLQDLPFSGPLGQQIRDFYGALVDLEAIIAAKFAPVLQKMLREYKDATGLFSFDDMLSLVWESLESERGEILLDTLRKRFRFALIDEFQDTDDLQWRIFGRIFHQSAGKNICYLIGDPKQAIYSFRGADIHTYLRARDTVIDAGGPLIPLTHNYRSSASVIAAYNHLFDQRAQLPFFSGEIGYDVPVACGLPERQVLDSRGKPAVPLKIIQLTRSPSNTHENLKIDDIRQGLGAFIAAEIKSLLYGNKRLQVVDQPGAEPRAITPGDIFILTRSRQDGVRLAEHLRQVAIPFAFFKQDGLFQTDEARHIYDLLCAIARPDDRSARLKAWLTPFFGLTLDTLSSADSLENAHPLLEDLRTWHQLAKTRQFESLFNAIIAQTGLLRRQIFAGPGEREITNYLHLFELLLTQAREDDCLLEELIVRLDAYITERQEPPGEDGNIQRLETDDQAVQIMTMHKSKGLEAEVVFLFGGLNTRSETRNLITYDEDDQSLLYVGKAPPQVKARHQREQAEEDQRLMYVALTRAKSRLYLPYIGFESAEDSEAESTDLKESSTSKNTAEAPAPAREYEITGAYLSVLQRLDSVVQELSRDPNQRVNAGEDAAQSFALDELFRLERIEYTRTLRIHDTGARARALGEWRPPDDLPRPLSDAEFAPIRRRRPMISSYTRLKSAQGGWDPQAGARLIGLEPDDFRADGGQQIEAILGPDGLPGGKQTGIFLHELVEKVDLDAARDIKTLKTWLSDQNVESAIKKSMKSFAVEPQYLDFCKKLLWRAIKTPLFHLDETENIDRNTIENNPKTTKNARKSPKTGEKIIKTPNSACVADFERTLRELEFLYLVAPQKPDDSQIDRPPKLQTPGESAHLAEMLAREKLSGILDFQDDYITGFVDLIFEAEGKFYFADWKSDILLDYSQSTLDACVADRYAIQATVYTLAMLKFLEIDDQATYDERFGGYFYLFLRGMGAAPDTPNAGIYRRRPDWQEVSEFEQLLANSL